MARARLTFGHDLEKLLRETSDLRELVHQSAVARRNYENRLNRPEERGRAAGVKPER